MSWQKLTAINDDKGGEHGVGRLDHTPGSNRRSSEQHVYAKVPVMQKAILQLKATLIATDPPVWRRLLVPSEYSFADLHTALQDAFGWTESHLHHFLTENPY